jgi:phenylalanyl-tRNA synthetase beta chain
VLGGREVELLPDDAVIADDEGPLEIAGVKGGERAAVTEATRRIVVHCGNYAPVPVRRTSTRLGLRSDASKRFENEITPTFAEEGMRRISALVLEACPDAKAGIVTDVYPVARKTDPVEVTAAQVSAMLGASVEADEIADLMARMDCVVEAEGAVLRITPPAERFDLAIPADIADEVGRIRGYNALPGALPPALDLRQPQDPLFWWSERVRSVLAARGYSEAQLYAFAPEGAHAIAYPLAEDKAFLRENLADRLADRLAFNRRNADLLGLDAVKLFEIGEVFPPEGERSAFAFGVSLTRMRKGDAAEDVLREDLHALEDALGIAVPDRTDSVEGGAVCEVDLTALLEKLPPPGSLADLGLEPMSATRYAPYSPYPFAVRDIALFVPDGIARADVQEVIEAAAGPLRARSWVFDEFVKQTDAGARHSYAFRIVFQSPERTLEDAEVNAAMEQVAQAVAGRGWEVR